MLRTLRQRLILSHIVPLLVVIPLVGIALIYTLETRVLLPSLSQELVGQASLVEEMAHDEPGIWSNPVQATAFVNRLSSRVRARVMLLDSAGRIMGASDAEDASRIGQTLDNPNLARALGGQPSVHTAQSRLLNSEVADVFLPSVTADGRVVGVVRLSYPLTAALQQIALLRYLILGVLAAGLLLGAFIGLLAALDSERPLQQTTFAIDELASGRSVSSVPETGPEEIRMLARSFNVLTARLNALEAARNMLIANLVHELGRPLGALFSAVQALVRGADADPVLREELLTGMTMEIHRLQRLIEDLAHLRKRDLGPLELSRQPLDLSQWLPEALSSWRYAAAEKGVRWQAEIPAGLPAIEADPDRLMQVVDNVVGNAVKYTPVQGVVSIDAGADDDSVWIRVSDTGPGIPADERERIFGPFYRGAAAGRFPQGMGLGLGVARDLVTAHGGQLTLESEPGLGSCFEIRLPVQDEPGDPSPA
jgi:signal transduction histidine kinase